MEDIDGCRMSLAQLHSVLAQSELPFGSFEYIQSSPDLDNPTVVESDFSVVNNVIVFHN